MIEARTVFEIHRLKEQGFSIRQIAKLLHLNRKSVTRYLNNPFPAKPVIQRDSKLDPFKEDIRRLLNDYPSASAVVIKQRIEQLGFAGGITIVRDYVRKIKKRPKNAFIRFESPPGEQMQIDWGHFGSLAYGEVNRRLYAMAVIEAYSRMLYVEFTHSQNQSALHQCLLNALCFFGGCPKQIVVDNMLTAVTERRGPVIRFNDAFLMFLTPLKITPRACHPAAPQEKGKIERAIGYIRKNFWPLRRFKDLFDVNHQARQWLDSVANKRIHHTTGKPPFERFGQVSLNPLTEWLDCREVHNLLVHKDFAVRFDENTYSVPPWTVGKRLTLKADQYNLSLYLKDKKLVTHSRCWNKKKRIELPAHRLEVRRLHKKLWYDKQVTALISIDPQMIDYLRGLADNRLPIKNSAQKLLQLKDQYGSAALVLAVRKAMTFNAYGAEYVENILHQQSHPKSQHPPVKLKDDTLNRIQLIQPSLQQYDAYAIKRNNDD